MYYPDPMLPSRTETRTPSATARRVTSSVGDEGPLVVVIASLGTESALGGPASAFLGITMLYLKLTGVPAASLLKDQ